VNGPAADAMLAARLFALDPQRLGGLWIRGGAGPVRDALIAVIRAEVPNLRRLPISIDNDRLIGGIDLGASLAAGRPVRHAGLLEEAREDVLLLDGAERARETLTGRLAQAMDMGGPAVVLLDDGGDDQAAPNALTDRVAFHLDLTDMRSVPAFPALLSGDKEPAAAVLETIGTVGAMLGVRSSRAVMFALRVARAHSRLCGRARVADEDVAAAVRLVLAPVATRLPADPDEEPAPQAGERPELEPQSGMPDEDVVVEAVRAMLPPDVLERLASSRTRSRAQAPRGSGARKRTRLRGRPVGARAGVPASGLRLALVDTLRAAAPWQALRGRGDGRVALRKDDLRVRRFEDRETVLTIFVVDASGSAAFARLAEAKGAVELLLERAYSRRAEVALIAFRGSGAELLLPPTRSLTRARRLLADLPGGGATPLAAGLNAARELAEAACLRGRTPQLVVLTDGRANVTAAGQQSREAAIAEALAAARRIAASGFEGVVLDIGARAQGEARAVADAMGARALHLPRADAAAMSAAVAA
jgi:magnesium chelatase subunit D